MREAEVLSSGLIAEEPKPQPAELDRLMKRERDERKALDALTVQQLKLTADIHAAEVRLNAVVGQKVKLLAQLTEQAKGQPNGKGKA